MNPKDTQIFRGLKALLREKGCEELGLVHAWEDITPNVMYTTNPPQYPDQVRVCNNCGRKEKLKVIQREERQWIKESQSN